MKYAILAVLVICALIYGWVYVGHKPPAVEIAKTDQGAEKTELVGVLSQRDSPKAKELARAMGLVVDARTHVMISDIPRELKDLNARAQQPSSEYIAVSEPPEELTAPMLASAKPGGGEYQTVDSPPEGLTPPAPQAQSRPMSSDYNEITEMPRDTFEALQNKGAR